MGRAAELNERRLDALRFRGPGTDLDDRADAAVTLGGGRVETGVGTVLRPEPADRGGVHDARSPSHGGTGALDPSSRPRRGNGGEDLEISFSGGKITEITASSGEDDVRAEVALDDGASYLGEVALVDERPGWDGAA